MNDETMKKFLREADAAAMPLEPSARLIDEAKARLDRRRRRTRAGAVFADLVAVCLGIFFMHPSPKNPMRSIDTAALDSQIRQETRMAQLLINRERQDEAVARLDQLSRAPGSKIWLQQQRDLAAGSLLKSSASASSPQQLAAVYREVKQLFPDAPAATVADARLSEIHE